jgi:glycosyl transferase family 25
MFMRKLWWNIIIVGLLAFFVFGPRGFFILDDKGPVFQKIVSPPPPYQGVGIFLINLDRSPERLTRLLPLMSKLPYPLERVPGVDGQALGPERLKELAATHEFYAYMGRPPARGEVGCFLGHVNAWRQLLRSPYAYALIFEDDVAFDPSVVERVVDDLIKQRHLWDICNLDIRPKGCSKTGYFTLKKLQDTSLRVYYDGVYFTDAYLINRKAARALLKHVVPMGVTVEDYFARPWEFGLKYTAVCPNVVRINPMGSIIGDSSRMTSSCVPRFSWWRSRIYRIKTGMIRFFYALKVKAYQIWGKQPTPEKT